jgi:ribosomal protein S27E
VTQYRTINDLIRDGMYMRIQCRKCRHAETIDPEDAKSNVANLRLGDDQLKARGLRPVAHGNPDLTLRGVMDGVDCPICGAVDWTFDAIKAPRQEDAAGE